MKQYFLKISGLAAIVLLLHGAGFAQDEVEKSNKDKDGDRDEIIIKRKGDKDAKLTIEIKDGQTLINGKPADEFEDDNLWIRKRKAGEFGDLFIQGPHSPFRGGVWNYNGDNLAESKVGFLGVSSEKSESGGAEIKEVTKGSAAEKIGLKKGDIITRIDDAKIDDPEDLTEEVRKHKPEDKIVVTFKRDGKEQTATAILGKFKLNYNYNYNYNFKMPKINEDFNMVLPPHVPGAWGLGGPRIGLKAQDTEDGKGVKVIDVDDESPAEKAGIKEGDIITQFDGKDVNSAGQLAELARAAKTKPAVKVKLNRDGKVQELEVKTPKKLRTADL